MSSALVALAALAVLAVLAEARPPAGDVPRMELADVLGRTLCPLRVVTDDDPLRIPRRIKFLTCDREALALCPARAEPACCRWRDAPAGCVEVYDSVLVQYVEREGADPRRAPRQVVQVPVGCACVLRPGTPAQPDD